jgi:hypothetical protein
MKRSLVVFFLTLLLLCAVLLRAANNNNIGFRIKKAKEEATKIEVKKDMEFVPNVILF